MTETVQNSHSLQGKNACYYGTRSDRVSDELWTEVHDIIQEALIKTIPRKKKCRKAKWFSEFSSWMNFAEWISQMTFLLALKWSQDYLLILLMQQLTLIDFWNLEPTLHSSNNPTGLPVYSWINLLIFCYWISRNIFFSVKDVFWFKSMKDLVCSLL